MRFPLPADPARRAFVIAVVCSVLLHILLLGSLVWVNTLGAPAYARRGEPLIVDIAPDKPEEKAPLGNPARPPGSQTPEPPKAAEPPAPRPKITPAPPSLPRAPAPAKVAPRRPEPAKQVAKATPPAELPAKAPEPQPPAPAPATPPPEPPAQPPPTAQPEPAETPKSPGASPSSAPSTGSERTALAKPPLEPPASIFRYPGGGGGGLYGGRGGRAGEPIPLDTPDPNYREYMEKVKQRIYAKWGYPYEAQSRGLQGKLVIEFHIAKDGHLQFIELRQTSGEEILDSFAMTAVKLAQVYPPLPDAMKREVLPIVAVFIYTLRGPLSVLQSLQ